MKTFRQIVEENQVLSEANTVAVIKRALKGWRIEADGDEDLAIEKDLMKEIEISGSIMTYDDGTMDLSLAVLDTSGMKNETLMKNDYNGKITDVKKYADRFEKDAMAYLKKKGYKR